MKERKVRNMDVKMLKARFYKKIRKRKNVFFASLIRKMEGKQKARKEHRT